MVKILRHKRIQNTLKYTQFAQSKEDEWEVATAATNVEEVKQLATVGFDKVDEMNGVHIFRMPRGFNSLRT